MGFRLGVQAFNEDENGGDNQKKEQQALPRMETVGGRHMIGAAKLQCVSHASHPFSLRYRNVLSTLYTARRLEVIGDSSIFHDLGALIWAYARDGMGKRGIWCIECANRRE
ncbi:hypothetical protein [Laceyella sediminis]|uniref:hypothetical protein n=1 Tax=Laceyella sediminis TaxID=573074 RepID=UPI000D07B3BD|nr:hypothetical protein [Laceyella sediminis]